MADRWTASGVTRKEAEVLAGLGEQLTNAEIAARLYVSERTVETHVSSLLRKLHASNRRELGRMAVRSASPPAPAQDTIGPSGTVTFLFTDIEDSTVLWERSPRLMPGALARHDAVLRDAIARHEGRIFSTAGDSFGAAFVSAPAAVAAAVDAQRTLAAEPWPSDTPVRVRMGLHTGTATERDGTYFGAVVNRAARIAAGGHGGQILLSVATADLVAGEGWTTVDLGWHRLRGIERPERIVRLDAPQLPIVALPLRAAREHAGNLPRASASLIGRRDELGRLVVALGTNTLVTITGPGGAGKTRLALAAAHAVADDFPDGAWLVELGELQSAADVAAAVATTLGLQSASGADGAASTVAALAGQRAVLLLDNCEHVIDGVIEFVTELESRSGRITVLATSREALGLRHELRFVLRPLGVDPAGGGRSDATELFCQRATGVLGSFDPSDADLAVIDEICRRLDGLPLAIELATARLSAMTLAELRAHLDDSFDVLSVRRGLTPRQQSLRATVAWSYDLLTPVEQGFFDQLSVFGADFGPGAARAVAGETTVPVDDLLRSLVDKSLLTATRGPLGTRFRQLETLRQYAEARLDAGGGGAASMRRHLDYFLTWTGTADAGVRGADELHWHHGFTAEWPNIRNAVRWACSVDDGDAACRLVGAMLWWATNRMRLETELWCELALDVPSASDHPLRPVLLSGAALFAHERGDDDGDRRALALARAEEERLGPASEPWVEVAALNQWNDGPAAALRDAAALQARADAEDDDFWRLNAALGEALILATLIGDEPPPPDAASVARIRVVVDQADAFGNPSSIASASVSLGMALRASEPDEALALLEKGLDLCAPLGVEITSYSARHELASHYTQLGRPLDALMLLRDALPHYLRVGTWHEVWPALANIAPALARAGQPRGAATVVGCIAANRSELFQEHYQLRAFSDELRRELGDAEFEGLLETGGSLSVGAVVQFVCETIDELTG